MSAQLPLALPVGPDQRFDCFAGHPFVVDRLQAMACGEMVGVFLEGPTGSGKTHLLLAACRAVEASGRAARYVPLRAWPGEVMALSASLPSSGLLALDDIDAVVGRGESDEALFHLHNRVTDAGGQLLYAATTGPSGLAVALPDLRSRFGQCLRLALVSPDEAIRREALLLRARRRGLTLDDSVLDYLFRRVDRDLKSLTAVLDRLDHAALAAKRRLTVPLVRQVLDQG